MAWYVLFIPLQIFVYAELERLVLVPFFLFENACSSILLYGIYLESNPSSNTPLPFIHPLWYGTRGTMGI